MKLCDAYRLADRIKSELLQYCDQIEIAGSIRRARPEVNDIDLVILPKPGQELALRNRIKARTTISIDGPQTLIVRLSTGFQLDVWIAHPPERDLVRTTPGNFGTLLVSRTGSREHNIYLCQRAIDLGLKWDPHHGVKDAAGQICASETEQDVFAAIGLPWIPPVQRERGF